MLAVTAADKLELVSSADTYEGSSPVWQRVSTPPGVMTALGLPAYDLRVDRLGDQTITAAPDPTNADPVQVTRYGERMVRLLVDPAAVYEVNSYGAFESSAVAIDAYDVVGTALGRFQLGVENNGDWDGYNGPRWQRGYIGEPGIGKTTSLKLPGETFLIEVKPQYLLTIGFVSDALDGGAQVVQWNDERSALSNRTLDFIESDQPVLVQPGKTYTLDAQVTYQGTTIGGTHSVGYTAYDADGLRIEPKHVERYGSSVDTRLVVDLNPGDTSFELVDASGWSNSAGPETRGLAWFGYTDSRGNSFADYSYTRNVASDAVTGLWGVGAIVGNRITLLQPWNGPLVRAGTAVRNAIDAPGAGLYSVVAERQAAPIQGQANVSGFRRNGLPNSSAFPPGTTSFRPAARLNEVLQFSGLARLDYRVSTVVLPQVIVDSVNHTRSVFLDVMANDAVALEAGTLLSSVSPPKYGSAQIVAGQGGARAQIRYTTSPYFVGTDRFTYTLQTADGQTVTESVTVSSLGGNLEANPGFQQLVSQNVTSLFNDVKNYGETSYAVLSGALLTSRPDNLSYLWQTQQFINGLRTITYSLNKGPRHGTLRIGADGTLAYQSDPGYVGLDSFEFTASDGLHTDSLIGQITVVGSNDELDRGKVNALAMANWNHESTYKRLFYSSARSNFDASGVPLLSWRVHILPFLGFETLYQRFRLNEPWNSPNNLPLLNEMPDIYRSSGDNSLSTTTRFQAIKAGATGSTKHFFNNDGSPRATTFSAATDGMNNTLSIVRSGTDKAVLWTKPDDLAFDEVNPLATLGNSPEAVIAVAFLDGKAALMPKNVLPAVFTALATVSTSAVEMVVDGATQMRAWSEQLASPVLHAQNYYRSQMDRMRELSVAVSSYESTFRALPQWGTTDTSGNRLLSWRVRLLPYLGHTTLYNQFRQNEPWDSPHNLTLLDSMPDVFRSASDASTSNTTRLRLLNGPGTLYGSAITNPRYSVISDGLWNTIFAVEAGAEKAVPWTMPETLTLESDFIASLGQLNDRWLRVINFESAVQLPVSTPNAVLQALATYNRGEVEGRMPVYGRGDTQSNLRIISLAIANFESAHKQLPVNLYGAYTFTKKTATPTLSWRVAILPYLEETALFLKFRLDEPWDSPHNLSLLPLIPSVFRSHGLSTESGLTRTQMFSGARTVLRKDGVPVRISQITDGSSNTIQLVESGVDKAVPWTKPSDLDGDLIDLWQALGNVGKAFNAATVSGDVNTLDKSNIPYLASRVYRDDGGNIAALEATQRIVLREGELAAIDIPTSFFAIDSTTLVQTATASLSPLDPDLPNARRLTMLAVDNAQADGVRVAHLTVNGRVIEIVVIDNEGLSLSADPNNISEAGGRTTLTVTRPGLDLQSPLVVQIDSSDRSRLTVPASVTIPAGEVSVTFTATAIDNFLPGDTAPVRVTAAAPGLNSASIFIRVIDDESLTISFTPASISEFGGVTVGTVSRLGGLGGPLLVRLTHDQPARASMPDQVIIPAGQSSIDFLARAIDNQVYNGPIVVHVIASAMDYVDKSGSFVITDYEGIGLVPSQDKLSETDDVLTITVTRAADSGGQPIEVQLQTDRPDKVQIPSRVVIPGHMSQVTIPLRTIDNRLLDGLTHVRVWALYGEPGSEYMAGSMLIDVVDHEALSLTMTPPVLSENNGRARGRLTRDNTDLDGSLTVTLSTSHPDLVRVPDSVTIPPGSEFVEFDVDALDNDIVAPDTRVRLEASHAAYLPESMIFTVSDHEELAVSFVATSGMEGSTLMGTVSRSVSNLDQPATIVLRSLDESEVEVPAGVVIPAGQRTASFTAKLLRDRLLDGTQIARLTAESTGYISFGIDLAVSDGEFMSVLLVDNRAVTESTGIVMARLTRSDINSELPLIIQATSSDPAVARVASTLPMDSHQASIEFPIIIPDDRLADGRQTVRLTFAAQDAAIDSVVLELQVEDDDRPWHNADNALDVDRSGSVTPLDALLVINYLNRFGSKPTADLPPPEDNQPLFVDTSNDQSLSAIDALLIINHLNSRPAGEGEALFWDDGDWTAWGKKRERNGKLS